MRRLGQPDLSAVAATLIEGVAGGVALVLRTVEGERTGPLSCFGVSGPAIVTETVGHQLATAGVIAPFDLTRPPGKPVKHITRLDPASPHRIGAELGLDSYVELHGVVQHEQQVLAWLIVLAPRLSTRAQRGLRRRYEQSLGTLVTALTPVVDIEPGYLVLDREARLTGSSPHLGPWSRDVGLAAALAGWSGVNRSMVVGGMQLQLTPLTGNESATWIARAAPARPVALAPDAALSPTQRRIAEFAVAGATVAEIARSVEASAETVRTHMREIYRRLHICSRTELVQLLAPIDPA